MRLLLDTHVFLWMDVDPDKLSGSARDACGDPENSLCLSVVSAWEIQIKRQLGRLTLNVPLKEMVQVQQATNGLELLAVELHHIHALDQLPLHHNDPFDRLLAAQAQVEGAVLVTADAALSA